MTRYLMWGADCDECSSRMNAERARLAAEEAGDGPLLCGSCRDEQRAAIVRDALVLALSTMQRQMLSDVGTDAPFNEDMAVAIQRAEEALAA